MKHIESEKVEENDFGNILVKDLLNDENHESFSIAQVKLDGEQGFSMNKKSDISYYILDGVGKFYFEKKIIEVKKGDVVHIPKNTKYKDEGKLTLLAVSSPRFDADSQVHFD